MSFIDLLLKRLDEEQANLAQDALKQPQGRDAFEYGRVSGLYAGFSRAKDIIFAIVQDKEQRENDL